MSTLILNQKEKSSSTIYDVSDQKVSNGQLHRIMTGAFGKQKSFSDVHVSSMNEFYNIWVPEIGCSSKPIILPQKVNIPELSRLLKVPLGTTVYYKFVIIKVRMDNHRENLNTIRNCDLTGDTYLATVYETIHLTVWKSISCQNPDDFLDEEQQEIVSSTLPLLTGSDHCQAVQYFHGSTLLKANFDEGGYWIMKGHKHFMQLYAAKILNYPMVSISEKNNAESKRSTNPNANVGAMSSKSSFAKEQMKNIGKIQKEMDQNLTVKCRSLENSSQKQFSSQNHTIHSLNQKISTFPTKKKKYDYNPIKTYIIAEVRSKNITIPYRSTSNFFVKVGRPNDGHLFGGYTCFVLFQYVHVHVPITIIMMILGLDRLQYIKLMYSICGYDFEKDENPKWRSLWETILTIHMLQHPKNVTTKEEALRYFAKMCFSQEKVATLSSKKIEDDFMDSFLPNCQNVKIQKAIFLAQTVYKLILIATGQGLADDLENWNMRRVDTNGTIWANVYRQLHSTYFWKNSEHHLKKFFEGRTIVDQKNRVNAIVSKFGFDWNFMFPGNRIGSRLSQGVNTGNFTASLDLKTQRTGICMTLGMSNESCYQANLTRIALPISDKNKQSGPRQYHSSSTGTVCSETSEGARVGLTLNFAIGNFVTPFIAEPETLIELFRLYDVPWIELNDSFSNSFHCFENSKRVAPKLFHLFNNLDSSSREEDRKNEKEEEKKENEEKAKNSTIIQLNGRPIGLTYDPEIVVSTVQEWRRSAMIEPFTSISWTKNQFTNVIVIYTEMGRVARPLVVTSKYEKMKSEIEEAIVTQDLKWVELSKKTLRRSRFSFQALLNCGVIEYVDKYEEFNFKTLIAPTPEDYEKSPLNTYTHKVLHNYLSLGANIARIPWPNKDQNPRLTFQSAMGKHSSAATSSVDETSEQISHSLYYPQKPIVHTDMFDDFQLNDICTGNHARVLLSGEKDNEEDGGIVSRSFVQMGGGMTSTARNYTKTCSRTSKKEMMKRPDPKTCLGMKSSEPYELQENGLPFLGQHIKSGNALIGKVFITNQKPPKMKNVKMDEICHSVMQDYKEKDDSQFVSNSEKGQVTKILCSFNAKENQDVYKVQHASTNFLGASDKFSSRHGQKNTAQIRSEFDMPFTLDGIGFDMILNPFGFPSRMTVGDQNDRTLCKIGALTSEYINSTAFTTFMDDEEIQFKLHCKNQLKTSMVRVIDGTTGEMRHRMMAEGYLYIQILTKHRASVTAQVRPTGPYTMLTRQPPESKSKDGGIRVGHMEKDAFIAYGASAMTKERMQQTCNEFRNFICTTCGQPCISNVAYNYFFCTYCNKNIAGDALYMSYDTKLLLQELNAMYIKITLDTQPKLI
jgi:DNA-directed RNA polymerase beta subunit